MSNTRDDTSTDPSPEKAGTVRRSTAARYGLALLAVALATGLRMAIDPQLSDHVPYITYAPAVLAAAWLGGFGPALLATAIGSLLADYFFISPRYSLGIEGPANVWAAVQYLTTGLASACLGACLHRARRQTGR